jgi:Ca2+-binding RTX toxin-like protein
MSTYVSISGGDAANVRIYGNGTVIAGNGNDSIRIDGAGAITVGAGNDHITLQGSGSIFQHGAGGHDTINLGHGADTITEAGHATVYGAFGSATITGGTVEFLHQGKDGKVDDGSKHHDHHKDDHKDNKHDNGVSKRGDNDDQDDRGQHHAHSEGSHPFYEAIVSSGNATLVGGSHCTQFVGGSGNVVMQGGTGNDTFVGGSGHTTMAGGTAHNLFEFTSDGKGGTDLVTNFVSGQDKLYLEGQSLQYLTSQGDVTVSHGNTFISLDGGKTIVELKGITNLTSNDVTTHKG